MRSNSLACILRCAGKGLSQQIVWTHSGEAQGDGAFASNRYGFREFNFRPTLNHQTSMVAAANAKSDARFR